jgi:hypothetical protein
MSAQSALSAAHIHCGSVTAGHPHYDTIREAKLIFGTSTFKGSMISMIDTTTTLVLFIGEVWFQTSKHANNILIVVLPCILISSKLFLPTNALFIET